MEETSTNANATDETSTSATEPGQQPDAAPTGDAQPAQQAEATNTAEAESAPANPGEAQPTENPFPPATEAGEIPAREWDAYNFEQRTLRAGACWQVLCGEWMTLRTLAAEAKFHGDHPIGDQRRFLLELQRHELQETYARMQLQNALDFLTSGLDLWGNYREHCVQIWGPELTKSLHAWWASQFEPYYSVRLQNHAADLAKEFGPHELLARGEPLPALEQQQPALVSAPTESAPSEALDRRRR